MKYTVQAFLGHPEQGSDQRAKNQVAGEGGGEKEKRFTGCASLGSRLISLVLHLCCYTLSPTSVGKMAYPTQGENEAEKGIIALLL